MAVDGPINKGDKLYWVQVKGYTQYLDQPVFWEIEVVGGGLHYVVIEYHRTTPDGTTVNQAHGREKRFVAQSRYWRSLKTAVFAAIAEIQMTRADQMRAIEKGSRLEYALEAIKREMGDGS